ncbi:hypothetical protein LINPERPRIM_LOCUS20647 [Linum perenne]
MAYKYTPAYYSTLHDSITSLCKNILPFSFKKRRLPAAEHRLAKLQSDNLKWQQDSYHQILNLMGLHKEGILAEHEVSTFRTHLLETLIASPLEIEHSVILRDKLLFLQELIYAKCITEEEYHSSKRPLLQRLAVQGAEIESRDVIVGNQNEAKEDEQWSVIDLKDEKCLSAKEKTPQSKSKSTMKQQLKGAASMFGLHKQNNNRRQSIFETEAIRLETEEEVEMENSAGNGETKSILMQGSGIKTESLRKKDNGSSEKEKRKPFRTLFHHKEQSSETGSKSSKKKQWGLKWKRNDSEEDETSPLPLNFERSDSDGGGYSKLVASPIGEGPDTKQIKRKLHSNGTPSDFFIDKVLGNNIKKELSRIQAELSTTNPNLKFSEDQIEAISTKLPVDKDDLNNFFPKSWCDRYGEVVLDVVKKEFKDHVGEMENMKNATREKNLNNSKRWTTFDDEDSENSHPNLFGSNYNSNKHGNDPKAVSSSFQNPFWNGASH